MIVTHDKINGKIKSTRVNLRGAPFLEESVFAEDKVDSGNEYLKGKNYDKKLKKECESISLVLGFFVFDHF